MRFVTKLIAVLVLFPALLTQTSANALPYDPYPWCAQYSGSAGGATNCGFLTIEQCRATVSGIGGFCAPNQFYNPKGSAKHACTRRGVLDYEMR
jgi:Protein of unknown function (DUF3551)